MMRPRGKDQLQSPQQRFPALTSSRIISLPDRDHRYRLIVPKSVWVAALQELAEEQEWDNVKNEVAARQGQSGTACTRALHKVWEIMYRLQESDTQRGRS